MTQSPGFMPSIMCYRITHIEFRLIVITCQSSKSDKNQCLVSEIVCVSSSVVNQAPRNPSDIAQSVSNTTVKSCRREALDRARLCPFPIILASFVSHFFYVCLRPLLISDKQNCMCSCKVNTLQLPVCAKSGNRHFSR